MKKRVLSAFLTGVFILAVMCAGCGADNQKEEEAAESEESQVLKIGASPNVVEVVKAMEDSLKEEGYGLEVVSFDDIQQPNVALAEGSLDGNLYQHKPFLESYNADNGTDLVFVEPLFGGFTALYSEKWRICRRYLDRRYRWQMVLL